MVTAEDIRTLLHNTAQDMEQIVIDLNLLVDKLLELNERLEDEGR